VNQTFARTFFGGENAIGRRVLAYQTRDQQKQQWLEVVGVAGDIRQAGVFEPARPELHVPHAQNLFLFMTFFVRTEADPVSLADAAKDAILQVDKDQPAAWVTTLDQIRSGSMADRRGMMFLLAVFAGVALLLAAVGIYGVISNSVSQRTHEIGIRMALGAQVTDVLRLVLRQGMLLVLFGVFAGLLGASLLTRVIASMLFEISPTDPITFAAISMLVTVVAVSACYFPARRASRVEPIVALRQE
jgi:putative ABC transport system permease protein